MREVSKLKYILLFVVLIAGGILAFNWYNNPARRLVDSWASCNEPWRADSYHNQTYTFYKNGTLVIDLPSGSLTGEYSFVSKDRVLYNLAPAFGGVYEVVFGNNGDYLNLTRMKGDEYVDTSLCFYRIGSTLYEEELVQRK
jgi:hypothetical protein